MIKLDFDSFSSYSTLFLQEQTLPQPLAEPVEEKQLQPVDIFLKRIDESNQREMERTQKRAAEERAAQQKREQNQKAAALQGRIAQLRSRIMVNKQDKKAYSELSMAKTQLFWLTNAF